MAKEEVALYEVKEGVHMTKNTLNVTNVIN